MKETAVASTAARIVTLSVLIIAAWSSPSAADTNLVRDGEGMESRLFRPAVDTKGHFTVDSTPVLPHMAVSLGMVLDFGFNQWVAVEQDGADHGAYSDTVVKRYITTLLMFNFGLFDRAVVGLQLPLIIPAGTMFQEEGDRRGWSSRGTFGDLVIHGKVHVTRATVHPVGLGLVLQYQAPTGKPELLTGEPGAGALAGKVVADVEPVRWYRAALNAGVRYPFGFETENHLNWEGPPMRLFDYGPMLTFGLGQSFTLWPGVMDFVVEVYGNQLISGFGDRGYTSLEAAGGFKFYLQGNSYLMAGYAHGIPLGGTDSGYGYQAMEHRMFLGFAFEPSLLDTDGDGIPDIRDECPLVPGTRAYKGCPPPPVPIGEPEEEAEDEGRVDIVEEKSDAELVDGAIRTLKKIYFEYNSDEIKEESFPILDQVAKIILDNPKIELLEIEGHADERGPERYNLNLTTKRAASVKRYLVKKGIDGKRLRSMGYGEYCPVRLGSTEADYEENRRVDFKVLKFDGEPTGVETGCPRARRKGVFSPRVR